MNLAEHIDANVPADIRDFSIWFCTTYGINGVCDPMYICNITAMHLGRGDGQGNFGDGIFDPYAPDSDRRRGGSLVERGKSRYYALHRWLYGSYTSCIIDSKQDANTCFHKIKELRMVAVS